MLKFKNNNQKQKQRTKKEEKKITVISVNVRCFIYDKSFVWKDKNKTN